VSLESNRSTAQNAAPANAAPFKLNLPKTDDDEPKPAEASDAPEQDTGSHLGIAELGALDTMMQAFLADGKLEPAEIMAYQAARAAFTHGEGVAHDELASGASPSAEGQSTGSVEAVHPSLPIGGNDVAAGIAAYQETAVFPIRYAHPPAPKDITADPNAMPAPEAEARPMYSPDEPPVQVRQAPSPAAQAQASVGQAPAPAAQVQAPVGQAPAPALEGLAAALHDYRTAILELDAHDFGAKSQGKAGLTGSSSHQVHFLPELMVPHGLRVLAWASLDREPTPEELEEAKALMESAEPAYGVKELTDRMLHQAADPAAAAVRLIWETHEAHVQATPPMRIQN
jgi:hypothetical protein